MVDIQSSPCTPEQIVTLIRAAQNERWSITLGEAIELIENYAAVAAAEAAIKATSEAYDKCIGITDEMMSKPLASACNEQIEGTKNLCTRNAGHPGGHRCLAVDVDNRAAIPLPSADRRSV